MEYDDHGGTVSFMRPYFIVNPVACGGKCAGMFDEVRKYLEEHGMDYEFIKTEAPGLSAGLALGAYERGERFLVSVGGDGTLSEIVSAIYDKSDVTLGLLPFGTGNDFARALAIPTEPRAAARVLLEGETRPVDAGLAGNKPFINVGGLGFDVDVVLNTERYKGKLHGMLPYFLGVMRSMTHLNRVPVKLTADGRVVEETALILSIANGTHFGGGMHVAPEADPSDGYFDVCMIRSISLATFLLLLPKFLKGRHVGKKPVVYFKAKEILVECERTPVQLDGELGEYAPVCFKVLKGALKMVLPVPEETKDGAKKKTNSHP